MKTTADSASTTTPPKPRALRRQADRSLFSTGDSGILLFFEDPALLAFVRNAAETIIHPANDLERVFTELAIRQLWRSLRNGTIETASIDVEMADHEAAIEGRWGKIDPVSSYHLSVRDPSVRNSVAEYSRVEYAAIRAFKETAAIIKSLQK